MASPRPSAAGRAPSQVACLILLGWDKGGQPAPRAPLPASSQGDYCPRANVLIAGRGCCSPAGPKAAGFGALLSGAGWRARLCRVLGYPQKVFFFSRCSAPDPLCPSSSGHAAQGRLPASPRFSLRQKGHRKKKKKPTNPAQRCEEGRKKPQASVGSGEKCSLIIHEGWLGRSRALEIPTYQPELLPLPKRAPFICFRLLH